MNFKKSIATLLVLLLQVFSSTNFAYEVYASGGKIADHAERIQGCVAGSRANDISVISRPVQKKEHQRVRYMGGECSYVSPCTVHFVSVTLHAVQKHDLFSSSFIVATCPVLFKLRGPPSFYCTAC